MRRAFLCKYSLALMIIPILLVNFPDDYVFPRQTKSFYPANCQLANNQFLNPGWTSCISSRKHNKRHLLMFSDYLSIFNQSGLFSSSPIFFLPDSPINYLCRKISIISKQHGHIVTTYILQVIDINQEQQRTKYWPLNYTTCDRFRVERYQAPLKSLRIYQLHIRHYPQL